MTPSEFARQYKSQVDLANPEEPEISILERP
jgi:hypothetical protein